MELPLADDLDYLLSWQPGQPLDRPANTGVMAKGQYESFDYKNRLRDAQYLNDLRGFFAERGINDKTDEELDAMLHDSSNYRDLNTLGSFFLTYGSQSDLARNSKTDEAMLRASRLHIAMQNAPTIFNKDGRSVSEALPSIAGAIVTDPVNWVLGGVEAVSGGMASPFVAGARAGITAGARRGLVQAAKVGAAEGAITGAISDIGQQSVEQELGLSDETSATRVLESAASSAALSAGLGGIFGTIGGAIGGFRGQRVVEGLKAKGYSEAEISSLLDEEGGLQRLQQMEPDIYRQGIEAMKQAEQDALNPPVDPIQAAKQAEDQKREIRIASHLGPLNDNLSELRQKLTNLRADNEIGVDGVGELDDQINETLDQIATLEAARQFPASLERRQKIVEELLIDPDQAKRAQGMEMVRQLAEDRARFEEVMASNVPEDISAFIQERVANKQLLEEGRRFAQEDGSLDEAARRAALKQRAKIVANDASTMAAAEGVVAKDTGQLAARTDAATKNQARLTDDQVSSADADRILEEQAAMEAEAKAMAKEAAAKAETEAAATEQVTEQVTKPSGVKLDASKVKTEKPGVAAEETPVAKPMPVTASTADIAATPVKASRGAKERAAKLGVDLAEVKASRPDGLIIQSDIDAHVTNNGASDTFVNSVNQLIEVLSDAQTKMAEMKVPKDSIQAALADPEVVRNMIASYNRDVLKGAYSDADVAALMDVYRSQLGDGKSFKAPSTDRPGIKVSGDVKTIKSVENKPEVQATGEMKPRDKAERAQYFDFVDEFTKQGFSEEAAHRAAGYEVYRARTAQSKKDVASLDPRMQKASPIPLDAEGNPIIKLQAMLRPGQEFVDKAADDGSTYSIQGAAPNAATFKFDKARQLASRSYELNEKLAQIELKLGRKLTPEELMSERSLSKKDLAQLSDGSDDLQRNWNEIRETAKKEGRAFVRSSVMPFVANGFERVRDSKNKPTKGDVVYVSGRSGKIFSDWRNAAKDANLPFSGDQMPSVMVDVMSSMRASMSNRKERAPARAASVDNAIKVGRSAPTNAESMGYIDFLQSLAEIAGAKTILPELPVSTSGLPALEKDGLRAFFINKKTGDVRVPTDKQIEAGQTAKNIYGKSSPDDWTVEYHDKSTPKNKVGLERARTGFAEKFENARRVTVKPPKVEELSAEGFTPSLVPKLQEAANRVNDAIMAMASAPGVDPLLGLMTLRENFTGKDVIALSDLVHRTPLPGVTAQSVSLLKAIADVEDIIAPNGFRRAEPLRDAAIKSVKTIFAKVPHDVMAPMVDLLGRLADGMAPKIAVSEAIPDMALDLKTSTILVNKKSKATVPQSFSFFHEIGHWAHMNLLSARDRAEFWEWAANNLTSEASVRKSLGIAPAGKIDPSQAQLADHLTKYFSNPAEFFAESFARWATARLDSASNPKMWQRFARIIKGIYDTVVGRKYMVDRDLEKLFLKVMPDRQADEVAENIDALQAGHLTPEESIPDLSPSASEMQPITSDPSIAARPNYMSLPMDELLAMGDQSRAPFIQKLKQVSAAVDDAMELWQKAEDSLDPAAAVEAYRSSMRLLIGSTTSLEEKRRLLANVARSKKTQVEPLYSQSDEPFGPFNRYLDIVPRSKKMRRMLSLARRGQVQAMDENDLVNLGDMPDVVSGVEAIEAGLSTDDDSKAAKALLSVFRGEDGKEKAGFLRMLTDMREALNTAYEQSGIIPQGKLDDGDVLPKEVRQYSVGRFNAISIGDVFKRSDTRGNQWTVEDVSADQVVTFRDLNGQILQVKGNEIDAFTRYKGGSNGRQVEELRKRRVAAAQNARAALKRARIDEARRRANERIAALGQTIEANPAAASSKELATDDLLRRVTSNTELAEDASDEVVRRELAVAHVPEGIKATDIDDALEGVKSMREKILNGDDTTDGDVAAVAATTKVQMTPRSKSVNNAIRAEILENRGSIESADIGVPPSATPIVTALLQNIEHRSRRVKYAARTLAYRALRMEHNGVNDKAITLTPDSEEWRALRGRVKGLAEAYTAGGDMDRLVDRTVALIYDTSPALKAELDALDYSVADAVELMQSTLGMIDRRIEPGERRIASELFDRFGYLLNGLIENGSVRNALHRATYFGDMLSTERVADNLGLSELTTGQLVKFGDLSIDKVGVDPSILARAGFNEIGIVRGSQFLDDDSIPVDFDLVRSPFDGFTSYLDLPVAGFEKTKSGKPRKRTSIANMPASAFGGQERKALAVLTAHKADKVRDAIMAAPADKREGLLRSLDDHLNVLAELGVSVPTFSIVAMKAKTPFKLATVIDNPKMVKQLRDSVVDAVEEGEIPEAVGKKIDAVLSSFKLGQSNEQLVGELDKVLTGDFSSADFIQTLGHDSMLDKYGRVSKVFDRSQIAPVRDFMDQLFYAPRMQFDDTLESPVGRAMNLSLLAPEPTLKNFTPPPGFVMANKADEHGLKHWLLNFSRNRVPRRSDALTPLRMKHRFLGMNSERMRSAGMVTLGNWFEDHFPWVQQEFARRILGTKSAPGPLRAIRTLPDAPSAVKRWLASSTGRNIVPESHTRLLNALWEPTNPRHEAKLTGEERAALKSIRDSLSKAFFDLRDAGVMMGSRGKNYFPQIWSQTAIRKEPDKAIDAFAKYFEIEAIRMGRPVEQSTLRDQATKVVAKLAEVDDQSMWDPDAHSLTTGAAENLDYARKISLDQYPEALKYLKPFLEQDLESYLVRYFDQVAHRLSLAKKFGFRNHAFGDYMGVVTRGRDGIAHLLSSRRTQEHSTFAVTPEDGPVDVSFVETYPMPFEDRPHMAVAAADEVIEIYNKLGRQQARKYLMDLAIPDPTRKDGPSAVYERRVDAIVDALSDFGGDAQNITSQDGRFLVNSMKVAARRPLISDTTYMVKAAKNLRAFNALTLLSYTTIASLGDALLPVVRSGRIRTSFRAWGKYMSDPDYRDAMKNVGASIESLLHNRMTHMTGTPANRLTSAFFNATGLTPWTDEMRAVGTAVGLEAFKVAQKKALNAFNPSLPIQQQSTPFRQNYRFLKRYGLESFATNRKTIDAPEAVETDQVRVALMKFVDDAVFSPNPDDVPLWAQTPWGAVMFQLKTFPTMMGRMAREVLYDDIRLAINDRLGRPFDVSDIRGTGNTKRALYLLSLMPLVGYGTNALMDVVRGRGGDGQDREKQERTLSKYMRSFPGYDKNYQQRFGSLEQIVDRETLDAFAGQYIAGFFSASGLGIIAGMFTDAATQAENGAFGTERMISTVFGPSAGTGISAWHVMQGALDGNERSTYPERTAMREALRRIPVLGGQNPIVESIIDEAIPKSQRRSNATAKNAPKLYSED
jgi:hypothetical protein